MLVLRLDKGSHVKVVETAEANLDSSKFALFYLSIFSSLYLSLILSCNLLRLDEINTQQRQKEYKMADSLLQKATSALGEVKETVINSVETAKTGVVKDAVDNVVSRGIDGAKSLVHGLEEKKGEVASKILGAVTHFTGSADSAATTANRDLPVSTDNQVPFETQKEKFKFLYILGQN